MDYSTQVGGEKPYLIPQEIKICEEKKNYIKIWNFWIIKQDLTIF